jgi:histidine triad (HIT) family protein
MIFSIRLRDHTGSARRGQPCRNVNGCRNCVAFFALEFRRMKGFGGLMRHWKVIAAVIVAFAIGQLDPVGHIYWKLAEWRLPEIKAESVARPSPFLSIPHEKWVGETANTFAFNDINHNAPVHILIVPKKRYTTILDTPPEIVAEMIGLAVKLARERHIDQSGFRLVINTNPQGAQSVYHLHLHLLGGRQMRSYD